MSTLLEIGLANAACAALLAVPALLAGRLRRPALAHSLWLLVLVKLVTPPVFHLPLPWLPERAPPPPVAEAPAPPAPEYVALPDTTPYAVELLAAGATTPGDGEGDKPIRVMAYAVPAFRAAPVPDEPAPAPAPPAPAPPPRSWDPVAGLLTLLGVVWLGGACVCLARAGLHVVRFQRLLRHARPAPPELQEQAWALAANMGLARCPPVWLVPGPLPPMVWGVVGAVRVYFPAGLVSRLSDDERASLLAHELAHVRRRDHWVRWLELVAGALYWWYPLAWLARSQMQAREEECCDAWAVGEAPARSYATAILEALDFLAEARPRLPVMASALAGVHLLRQRLTLIMTTPTPKRVGWAGRLTVLALAGALLPLLPTLARSERKVLEVTAEAAPAEKEKEVAAAAPAVKDEPTAFAATPANVLGGNDEFFSLALSPDGRFLAAGGGYWDRPGYAEVFDLTTRKPRKAFTDPRGVASVDFSPDGKRLVMAGYNRRARVLDLDTGRAAYTLALDGPARAAFSPDGKLLATATEGAAAQLWEAATGKAVATLPGDLLRFHCVSFSRGGQLLAAGGGDWKAGGASHVLLWDVAKRKQVAKLSGHKRPVLAVTFSPDDQRIATGDVDGLVRLYDAKTARVQATLRGHAGWVEGLAFSPDGARLASASHDRTVRVWDADSGRELTVLRGHRAAVRSVRFTASGEAVLAGGGDKTLKGWDAKTGAEVLTLRNGAASRGEAPPLVGLACSPDGKLLATPTEDGAVLLRDADTGQLRFTLKGHAEAVTCVTFAPDGRTLATGSPDKTVKLWDPKTGKVRQTLTGHTSWVYALAYSRDGRWLASGGYDKTVRLWDAKTGKARAVFAGHTASVRSVAFAADGRTLASGGGDKVVKLWDLPTLKERKALPGHTGTVRALTYAPLGTVLASAGDDGTVRLWDGGSGAPKATLRGHTAEVLALTFSPAGKTLASAGQDGTIQMWDPLGGKPRGRLRGHADAVSGVAFAPGAGALFSAGHDGALKRWPAALPAPRLRALNLRLHPEVVYVYPGGGSWYQTAPPQNFFYTTQLASSSPRAPVASAPAGTSYLRKLTPPATQAARWSPPD